MPYRVNTCIYQGIWNYDGFLSGLIWLGSCTAFAITQPTQALNTLAHALPPEECLGTP
jgi:hypothetical protein